MTTGKKESVAGRRGEGGVSVRGLWVVGSMRYHRGAHQGLISLHQVVYPPRE